VRSGAGERRGRRARMGLQGRAGRRGAHADRLLRGEEGRRAVKRILVVEDNELNREVLTRRLTKAGFQSAIAGDGATAVEMAKAELPDLILMDMNLPVL